VGEGGGGGGILKLGFIQLDDARPKIHCLIFPSVRAHQYLKKGILTNFAFPCDEKIPQVLLYRQFNICLKNQTRSGCVKSKEILDNCYLQLALHESHAKDMQHFKYLVTKERKLFTTDQDTNFEQSHYYYYYY